jgi:hypothetical protein
MRTAWRSGNKSEEILSNHRANARQMTVAGTAKAALQASERIVALLRLHR